MDLSGQAGRFPVNHPNDDFVQAGALYSRVMTDQDRANLIGNLVDHLGSAEIERLAAMSQEEPVLATL